MSKLRIVAAGLIASGLFAQAAAAADLGGGPPAYRSFKDEPYARPFTWSGLYVGAHLGYGWTDANWDFSAGGGSGFGDTGSGGLAGGQIGYNWQAGRIVFGVEGDVSSSWMSGSTGCPAGLFACDHSVNWMASARGRLGITVNDNRTLLYGTAGAAWANADWTSTPGGSFSKTQNGWVAGAGIEHMLTDKLSARVEYLYYGFDSATAPAGTLDLAPTKLDLSSQVVRFGLNLKF